MKRFSRAVLSVLALLGGFAALPAHAQCPAWKSGFHVNGTDGDVFALAAFDVGSGPKLYAGGRFSSASGVAANDIAVWNGSAWSALGSGIQASSSGGVFAIAQYDDGSGPALYAAGNFTQAGGSSASSIAKWDGAAWSPLGSGVNGTVGDLIVFDDGSGPALFVTGNFMSAGGVPATRIAKWNGSTWSALGLGLQGDAFASAGELAVFDDGTGPALFAAGRFEDAGNVVASNIAKWDGSTWSALGFGTDSDIRALAVFDDGSGEQLYAAGLFHLAGGVSVPGLARWDGSSWSAYGASVGTNAFISELAVFDDGSGPALHACGSFAAGSGAGSSVVKWNGTAWDSLGTGIHGPSFAMAVFDDGSGARLLVGGEYTFAGGVPANNIAAWSGSSWSGVGDGEGVNNTVEAMLQFDDGSGPALYVGGAFSAAGATTPSCIAKWDGTAWTPLSSGMSVTTTTPASVDALAVFDDGSGPALYAGGYFSTAGGVAAANIAKWDGSAWSALGSGIGGASFSRVDVLAVFDGALYAGGNFTTAGGTPANYIARWDGSSWSAVGSGMDGTPSAISVGALAVFDDGSGPALYAGGSFNVAGGVHANNIAKWDGSAWSPVGGSTNHVVTSLAVFDDGSGAQLYVGGYFTMAGGTVVQHIARWNGSTWSAVGSGLTGSGAVVHSLAVFDDGAGLALFAGGTFTSSGSATTNAIARWDGTAWAAVDTGVSDFFGGQPAVLTLAAFGDAWSRAIYAGGLFTKAGGKYSHFIGAWSACPDAGLGVPFCFGDGTGAACPCGNFGLPGHGCKNSSSVRGAELTAAGYSSLAADTVVLTSTFENHNATSVFLQGTQSISPVFFGDGLRCAGGTLKRLFVVNASSTGTVSAPTGNMLPISARSAALGDEILAGETREYQVYYRDSSLTFCPAPMGSTFNVSQALRILWSP